MIKHNAANERIKRDYFAYLREAKRQNEASIDMVAKALDRFEQRTRWRDFAQFHPKQAVAFKQALGEQASERTGERLSKATLNSTLRALRAFFFWLAGRPGFRSRIAYSDADYFNLPEKDVRIARAERDQPAPTLEQIHHVLAMMPTGTDIELRDRALIAFAILTGARDAALASLKLKHVDLAQGMVLQDAREVKTKASKTISTWFFPIGGEALAIVQAWIGHLRTTKLWGDNDPLFPATLIANDPETRLFAPAGLARKEWGDATPVRKIFRSAFTAAGLPYFNPHSFRKTLSLLGLRACVSPEHLKAWSQNLGHDAVLTTLKSYGTVPVHRQAELIRSVGVKREETREAAVFAQVRGLLDSLPSSH